MKENNEGYVRSLSHALIYDSFTMEQYSTKLSRNEVILFRKYAILYSLLSDS